MKKIYEEIKNQKEKIAVVGLGYVGLPLLLSFSKKVKTIGYDVDERKLTNYSKYENDRLELTSNEKKLNEAQIIIVAVPTPIDRRKTPDLTLLKIVSKTVAKNMRKGAIIVYESTVYPGVTEDICVPILEEYSNFQLGKDFKVGYSPERINPGDQVNVLENITKIVSGSDDETRDLLAKVYDLIIEKTHKVNSIKVAEAAKISENVQRDINIAFMNELAMIFDKMDIHTDEVIKAMNTKWNALKFTPGLVGGHCIGVDPYYLLYEADKLGYQSQIIASSRRINDYVPKFIVDILIKKMLQNNKDIKQSKIYIMGITFKADCDDIRNSKAIDIVNLLNEYGIEPIVVDPVADMYEISRLKNIKMVPYEEVKDADSIIFTVDHQQFKNFSIDEVNKMYKDIKNNEKILIDIKSLFSKKDIEEIGISYYSL